MISGCVAIIAMVAMVAIIAMVAMIAIIAMVVTTLMFVSTRERRKLADVILMLVVDHCR